MSGELKRGAVDEVALREFLQHNEFNSWLRELGAEETSQSTRTEPEYTTVMDMASFQRMAGETAKVRTDRF